MPAGVKKCKVCGREYPYCRSMRAEGIFKWQDVACCPEHGEIYLRQVLEARGVKKPEADGDAQAAEPKAAKAAKKTRRTKKVEPEVPADSGEMA